MALVSDQEWAEYKAKFNKCYADEAEDKMRRDLYQVAKGKVDEHNRKYAAGEVTWSMAINHLADATEDEMARRAGKKVQPPTCQ